MFAGSHIGICSGRLLLLKSSGGSNLARGLNGFRTSIFSDSTIRSCIYPFFSESVVRNRNKINFHNSLTFTMIVEQICSLLWIAAIRLLLKIEYVYQMQALTLRYISVSPC